MLFSDCEGDSGPAALWLIGNQHSASSRGYVAINRKPWGANLRIRNLGFSSGHKPSELPQWRRHSAWRANSRIGGKGILVAQSKVKLVDDLSTPWRQVHKCLHGVLWFFPGLLSKEKLHQLAILACPLWGWSKETNTTFWLSPVQIEATEF